MYKKLLNRRCPITFKRFSNKGYALFSVLGCEVLIGTLSVATVSHAKAAGRTTEVRAMSDTVALMEQRQLQEVNITGTKAPLTMSQQARMVTVLSGDDIQKAPVQSVNDLLKYLAGVDVRQKGPLGALTDVSIRGGTSEQVAILLNGINIGDAQTAHNALDYPIDKADIERIEILEGPAARSIGTSSLLGAINIVTKKHALSNQYDARLEGGSYGYLQAAARAALTNEAFFHSLSASFTRSDGYLRSKSGNLSADYQAVKGFYQGAFHNKEIAVNWHLGMSHRNFGSNTFYSVNFDNQFEHTFKIFSAVQAHTLLGKVHLSPSVYWNRGMDRFELVRGDESKIPFNHHRTDVGGANLNAWFDWIGGRTAFGGEMRYESIVSTVLGNPLARTRHIAGYDRRYTNGLNRTNIQLSVEHNVVLGRFTVSGGFMAVANSQADIGMRLYPGVDLSWRPTDKLSFFAGYNSSLRMPSFTELFYSVGGYKADPHLRPEELSSVELGTRYRTPGIQASARLFYNRYTNLIDWISDGVEKEGKVEWKSVNFGKIEAYGAEARVALDLRQLLPGQRVFKTLQADYCYLYQQQDRPQGIVSRYALEYLRHKFTAGAEFGIWRALDLQVHWRLQHRHGQYLDSQKQVQGYNTYGLLDARLQWTAPKWTAYLSGNNLLNKSYIDYGNVPQPGTWIVAGMSISL